MPIGIEMQSTRIIAPKTSEAVIGAARRISSFTDERSTKECPSERSTTSRLRKVQYLHVHGVVQAQVLLDLGDHLGRGRLARRQPRRIRRHEEEDHVGHDRHREEQDDRPEQPADEIAEHGSAAYPDLSEGRPRRPSL